MLLGNTVSESTRLSGSALTATTNGKHAATNVSLSMLPRLQKQMNNRNPSDIYALDEPQGQIHH